MRQQSCDGSIQHSQLAVVKIRYSAAFTASFMMMGRSVTIIPSGTGSIKYSDDPRLTQLLKVTVNRCQTQVRHIFMQHIIKLLRCRMTLD